MEMLVYVRNHGGPTCGDSYAGAVVGAAPRAQIPDTRAPLTSMAEFRVDGRIHEPVAELRTIVRQLFELVGTDAHHRPIYCSRPHSALKVVMEPGFDTPREIEQALGEMLGMCRPAMPTAIGQWEHEKTPSEPIARSAESA